MADLKAITHPEYDLVSDELKKIRDCIEGAAAVKRETYTYLPHPSQIDKTSVEQKARYCEYLAGAEYDNSPDDLRRSLLGKMRISSTAVELPDRIAYLEQNSDGDGMPLSAAIEYAVNNVLQTKWHILVSDFKGAPAKGQQVSKADAEKIGARAEIKQYTRENVVNWQFSRINGVMQLSWIKLVERTSDFDQTTGSRTPKEEYLILALNEDGNYYQQKIICKAGATDEISEATVISVAGKPLKWLPVAILADEELPTNCLPKQTGYLSTDCDIALNRYRVSAVYKETQRNLAPTTYTSGWKSGDVAIFEEANGGRSYVATGAGAVNNMPDGVTVEVVSASANMDDFHWYFDNVGKKIDSRGGRAGKAGAMTATEAAIMAADQNALLETIADNCEQAFKRMASYCAMFEGLWKPEAVEDNLEQITIDMPRDFATPKLSVEERQQSVNEYTSGAISLLELQRQLSQGGATVESIETIMAELESEPPKVQPIAVVPQTKEAVPNE